MKLLYKELALAAHPTLFIFMALGCLVLVPSYPSTVVFMFGCLAPYITLTFARENNDAWYTAMLPVQKKEIVKAKCLLIATVQLGQLLISIPCALLRNGLGIGNNPVGIDVNAAWYGVGLLIFSLFDLVFFPAFYKSGYKAGKSFFLAMLPVLLLMIIAEAAVHFPALSWLDSAEPAYLARQLPILAAGTVCYAAGLPLAYRIAAKRMERAPL